MKKRNLSSNGFLIRRPSSRPLGSVKDNKKVMSTLENRRLLVGTRNPKEDTRPIGQATTNTPINRIDVEESLKRIDDFGKNDKPNKKKLSRRQRKLMMKMAKRPKSKLSRFVKWLIILILILVFAVGAYTAFRLVTAGNNIFKGSILDIIKNDPLKQDDNGRSNFLILGTSEDDPNHGGADLTDSMLVVSIDQTNKNLYMFSVPRDLYVDYGQACYSGYAGKINAYFICSNQEKTMEAEQERLAATQKLVGNIFGIDIQYGIHVNHTVIKEVVNTLNGIDVDIQGSNGAPGILDRNFDWRCNYKCYLVKYDNGVHHLDGEHALFLAQARGDVAPTYGLGNSNFDRERNQQKILMAIREKALSTGTLTNLGAITGLIDALGNNLRTNIQSSEIRTLMQIANDIKSSDMNTLSLLGDDTSLVTTGSYGGASVVMPSAGIFEYGEIQEYIKKNLTSDPVARESAPIVVLNGSGQAGLAQQKADELSAAGFNITSVDNAPDGEYEKVEIYQIGDGNEATAKKLSDKYKVTIKNTAPPLTINGNVRFVIIFGASSAQ